MLAEIKQQNSEIMSQLSKPTGSAPNSATLAKLIKSQSTRTPPVTKKLYLLDAKRWIQWAIWGMLVFLVASFLGWNVHLHRTNQSLNDYALRYRILRMEHSASDDPFTQLDSVFETHRSDANIKQLKQ